jgi:hypothetical protein
VAHELGETSLTFMVHPTLPREALMATVATVRDVVRCASR